MYSVEIVGKIYFLTSKVDSSWKTWAREKTVLVFLFRLWLFPSDDCSMQSSSSSASIDSLISSSDSSCDEFNCWLGVDAVVAVVGELFIDVDVDCLSGVLCAAIIWKKREINQLKYSQFQKWWIGLVTFNFDGQFYVSCLMLHWLRTISIRLENFH